MEETQVLVGARGAYRLAQALPSIQVPATVQAVLAARIDRLLPEEKQLLQTAAVIGTEVPLPLLQAIAELPEDAMYRGLAHLQAAEFLYETRLFPEREYTFKHALTHEVAYASLLQERRRALHARIVETLEGLALAGGQMGEQVERLAHHALRGEVWDKALLYCCQASAKAMARSALREVVMCCEQALTALQHLPESRDTLEQAIDLRFDPLRHALWQLGEHQRILDHLHKAKAIAEALDDPWRLGWALSYMTNGLWLIGDNARALASGQCALVITSTLKDFALQLRTNLSLAQVYHALGDYRRATDLLKNNVASLQGELLWERFGQAGLPSVLSRSYLLWCLAECGEFAAGITCGE
jgi:tetratricopeptide (TPR) repeat protein